MDEILATLIPIVVSAISIVVSAVISFLVARFYGARWVEAKQRRREHSVVLKDEFFKPWLEKMSEFNIEYCKLDAQYSPKMEKMVPLQPSEPDNLKFYHEAMSHLKSYTTFLEHWKKQGNNTRA